MELIFNELSIQEPASNKTEAGKRMHYLIDLIRTIARRFGVSRALRTKRDIMYLPLAKDYSIREWLNDGQVDKEQRLFFKSVANKSPFLEDIIDAEESLRKSVFDFFFDGICVAGLGAAYLLESPAVSFIGDPRFKDDPVEITLHSLDDSGEKIEQGVKVCCLSTLEQIEHRKKWFIERLQREIQNGLELWEKKRQLFKYLTFCDSTKKQIEALNGGEPYFQQVCRHLFAINDYVTGWSEGPFKLKDITWSEESKETMKHPRFGPLRHFLCMNDITRIFSKHSKPTGGNIRIHFFPIDDNKRTVWIGYIGPHLPTVRNSN